MTFISCECPLPAAIGDLSQVACGENIGQIVKIAFQRRQAAAPFPGFAGAVGDADLQASWDVFKAAVDGTKIQTTPFMENVVIPAVEAITEGGDDNTTLDGQVIVVGASTISVTGTFRSLPAANLRELKQYACEGDLSVYLINEFGKIVGQSPDDVSFQGIPIKEFFVGDGGNEGKNTQDKTNFRFNMNYGWRDYLKIVTPTDFNGRDL